MKRRGEVMWLVQRCINFHPDSNLPIAVFDNRRKAEGFHRTCNALAKEGDWKPLKAYDEEAENLHMDYGLELVYYKIFSVPYLQ